MAANPSPGSKKKRSRGNGGGDIPLASHSICWLAGGPICFFGQSYMQDRAVVCGREEFSQSGLVRGFLEWIESSPLFSHASSPPWSDRYKWAKDTLHTMSGGAPPPPDNKGMRKRQEDGIVQATKVEEESHNRSTVEGGGDLKGSLGNRRRLHKPAQPVRWPRKPSLFFLFSRVFFSYMPEYRYISHGEQREELAAYSNWKKSFSP